MDNDGDGGICFNEFVAATLHIHQLEDADSEKFDRRLKLAFAKFDTDNDGFIDAEELRVVRGWGRGRGRGGSRVQIRVWGVGFGVQSLNFRMLRLGSRLGSRVFRV